MASRVLPAGSGGWGAQDINQFHGFRSGNNLEPLTRDDFDHRNSGRKNRLAPVR